MVRHYIEIKLEDNIKVNPKNIFESEVVKSGNGAVIKAFKKFIGKKVVVIVRDEL